MATKSAQPEVAKVDIEELLDILEQTLDRTKVMYEQYFLGIQKMAPAQLHAETERRIRDLTQMNIRNTALRYRFATVQQKFGSYNAYWRRTLRQIESGKYIRNLQKIGRNAARSGEEIPEEILNAMPKRMREQVKRDREMALANAARRAPHVRGEFETEEATQEDLVFDSEGTPDESDDGFAAIISEPSELRRSLRKVGGAHIVDEADSDLDLDAFFAQVAGEIKTEDPTVPPGGRPRFRPSQAPPIRDPGTPTAPEPTVGLRPATGPGASNTSVSSATRGRAATAPPQLRGATPPPELLRERTPAPVLLPKDRQTPPPVLLPKDRQTPPPVPRAQQPPPPPAGMPITPVPRTTSLGMPATQRAPARLPNLPPITRPTPGGMPPVPDPPPAPVRAQTTPSVGGIPVPARIAPSQITRPNPIAPGSSNRPPVPVETMQGPFPRTEPKPRANTTPGVAPGMRPPPGMSEQDVNTLYTKYIKAKEMVGEDAGPAAREKLLKTIHSQAPKIMEQYKAKGVDFSVVVKDNQVIIRAKPKT